MTTITVFIHHDVDAVTQGHWSKVCKFSDGPVVAVSASNKRLPQGLSILDWPREDTNFSEHLAKNLALGAKSTDLLLVAWFKNRSVSGDSYFIVESDTLINCDIARWLEPVRNFPFSAPSIRLTNREPEWEWFRFRETLPAHFQPFACGIVPFTCLSISHTALSAISDVYPCDPGSGNGELRLASAAAYCGFPPVANPHAGSTIACKDLSPIGLAPTIYHPVKKTIPMPHPWMQPDEIVALERLIKPEFHVLEYGSGASTFWFAERVRKVTTIEHSGEWLNQILPLPPNVDYVFQPPAWPCSKFGPAEVGQFDKYIEAPKDLCPDFVLVDGRARVPCANLWANRVTTVLHDANRDRYSSLTLQFLAKTLALVRS